MGHQGCNRTLSLMKEWFWWPGMSQALLKAVANCGRCIQYEAKGQLPPMQPIICTEPMELVHIDYVGMEVTVVTDKKPVVKNVLVVVDHFTQYVQAFVTKNHTARTTARVLYNNYFSVFGFPNASCRTREQNSVEKLLRLCAVYWVLRRSGQPRTTLRPMGRLKEYTRHYNAW